MNKPANNAVTVAMVQDNFLVGDISGNADKIIRIAREVANQGADLAVFPELALVGYPPEDLLYRPGFITRAEAELERIQAEVTGTDVLLGVPLLIEGELYNSAVWIRQGERIAIYHKQQLPNHSVFDEVRYFQPGSNPVVVELQGVHFGIAICEDAWDPQPISNIVQAGAEAILVLNASPFHIGKVEDRLQVLQQRARENAVPLIYLNTVGGQDELVFDGESMVVDKTGGLLLRAAAFEPSIDTLSIGVSNIAVAEKAVTTTLDEVEAVYKCLVLGVRDFVHKNGFSGVVIGLSGGVDSALTLAIAVDALGAENVQAVMMPSQYTADISQQDAKAEAKKLKVKYDIISIESVFAAFLDSLENIFAGAAPDVTEENIQARCRGLILMAISNKTGRMLLTTGNKSEVAVGYATLYGDMSGGFAPLKDVSKTLVYKLCRYRNGLGEVIPERVLTRAPSAELRPDQTDQDSLPDYAVLDKILELSVEQDKTLDEIVATGIDRETVQHVVEMVRRNEYKRRQAAPGVRITQRAFGRDRRYPITSGYRHN